MGTPGNDEVEFNTPHTGRQPTSDAANPSEEGGYDEEKEVEGSKGKKQGGKKRSEHDNDSGKGKKENKVKQQGLTNPRPWQSRREK